MVDKNSIKLGVESFDQNQLIINLINFNFPEICIFSLKKEKLLSLEASGRTIIECKIYTVGVLGQCGLLFFLLL